MKRLTDKQVEHLVKGKRMVREMAARAAYIQFGVNHRTEPINNLRGHIFHTLPFTESPEETTRRELDRIYNSMPPIIVKNIFPSDYTII